MKVTCYCQRCNSRMSIPSEVSTFTCPGCQRVYEIEDRGHTLNVKPKG